MKNAPLFYSAIISILFTSCSTMYQVYETKSDKVGVENEWFKSHHDKLNIAYNFWGSNGIMWYVLSNDSDDPVYIDWDRSHFIFNGESHEYWHDEEQTKSFYSTATSTYNFANALLNSLSGYPYSYSYRKQTQIGTYKFKPKQIIELPPHSRIYVSKFDLTTGLYFNCDFNLRYKSARQTESIQFGREETPFIFRNYITYSDTPTFEQVKRVDDEFYVASITNMNMHVFNGKQRVDKVCTDVGKKIQVVGYELPYESPRSYYVKKYK